MSPLDGGNTGGDVDVGVTVGWGRAVGVAITVVCAVDAVSHAASKMSNQAQQRLRAIRFQVTGLAKA